MPICPTCGEVNPDRARFCLACATPIQRRAQPAREARKTITVLFSDLVGSTAMGERLDPESVRRVMTRYYEEMRKVIEHHEGHLEKFIGDAVVARFGIPVVHEDDALRAVRAAVEMREALGALNQELQRNWGIRLNVRMGVNTGEVVAARPEGDQSIVLGDAVNVAARFEQAAGPGEILIGEPTFILVRHAVEAEAIEPLSLKGKAEPVSAYRLVSVRTGAEAIPRRLDSPLVGRERELDVLVRAYSRVHDEQRGGVVTVLGPPGAGKSRLVAEFLSTVESSATILRGRCRPYGERALAPIAEALEQIVRGRDSTPPEELADFIPSLLHGDERAGVVIEHVNGVLGRAALRGPSEDTYRAVGLLLESLARTRPVVVALDDLHWADPALLGLIDAVASFAGGSAVLILGAARPEVLEIDPRWEQREDAISLHLEPLSEASSTKLVSNLLGEADVPHTVAARIVETAAGNPLFIEEALKMLIDEGRLKDHDGRWIPSSDLSRIAVPPTVQAIIAARLDRLPSEERLTLERASVAGASFTRGALDHLSHDHDPASLARSLAALVGRDLVRPLSPNLGEDAFQFRHAMVRETVYRAIPKGTRAELHERAALWIRDRAATGDRDEPIGYHLERAVHLRRELGTVDDHVLDLARGGARHLALAFERTIVAGDRRGAADLNDRIKALLAELSPKPAIADVEVVARAGKLMVTLGDWEGAVGVLSRYDDLGNMAILRDLGVALCKLHRAAPTGAQYRRGQQYLEMAAAMPTRDVDAVASLAGSWKGIDDHNAHRLYERAVQLDRADPYALGNWIEYEVSKRGDQATIQDRADEIRAATARCRSQADDGENLPWAFYDIGKFSLLIGKPEASLIAYAKAVYLSAAEHMLESAAASLERVAETAPDLPGRDWATRLMFLGQAALFGSEDALLRLRGSAIASLEVPGNRVIIVAGGSHRDVEEQTQGYREMVLGAFDGFAGLLVSGGTTVGVSRLVGELQERFPNDLRTVGYVPGVLPAGQPADNARYTQIRRTVGRDFGPLESLQYWTDLLASGIRAPDVRLVGIGGGILSAIEYRIALALGCRVGVLAGSGRAVDRLLSDRDWATSRTLGVIPNDADSLRDFLAAE